jgi:hypothetical protein
MDTTEVEIKNIKKLLEEDPYIKPYEKEIRRRYDIDNLIRLCYTFSHPNRIIFP